MNQNNIKRFVTHSVKKYLNEVSRKYSGNKLFESNDLKSDIELLATEKAMELINSKHKSEYTEEDFSIAMVNVLKKYSLEKNIDEKEVFNVYYELLSNGTIKNPFKTSITETDIYKKITKGKSKMNIKKEDFQNDELPEIYNKFSEQQIKDCFDRLIPIFNSDKNIFDKLLEINQSIMIYADNYNLPYDDCIKLVSQLINDEVFPDIFNGNTQEDSENDIDDYEEENESFPNGASSIYRRKTKKPNRKTVRFKEDNSIEFIDQKQDYEFINDSIKSEVEKIIDEVIEKNDNRIDELTYSSILNFMYMLSIRYNIKIEVLGKYVDFVLDRDYQNNGRKIDEPVQEPVNYGTPDFQPKVNENLIKACNNFLI